MIHDIRSSKADGAITVIQLHEMADFGKSEQYLPNKKKFPIHEVEEDDDKNQKERKQEEWIF